MAIKDYLNIKYTHFGFHTNEKNKIKELFKAGKPNSWLAVPSSFSAEVMANQGWDLFTIDMQHGLIDYPNAVNMLQAISTTETTPMARVN